MSICMTKITFECKNYGSNFTYVGNTTEFWLTGNSLANKISELNIFSPSGTVNTIWKSNETSTMTTTSMFRSFNVISGTQSVDFCHTIDLSVFLSYGSKVQVVAVNDITLAIHLPGQLSTTCAKYNVLNENTTNGNIENRLFIYGSELSIYLEETSFDAISLQHCKNYDTTWTHDDCILEHALEEIGHQADHLRSLLNPNGSHVRQGIEQTFLQDIYAIIMTQNVEKICLPDCRSLVVNKKADTSLMTKGGHSVLLFFPRVKY